MNLFVIQGKAHLNTPVQVPLHPVGGRKEVQFIAAILKNENTRMLKEAINDADDFDILAHPLDARNEAANPPHHKRDLYARRACLVESGDHFRIFERIHLGNDGGGFSFFGILDFVSNQPLKLLPHIERRNEQMLELRLLPLPPQDAEYFGHFRGQLLVTGEKPEVRVKSRRAFVEIPRAEIGVQHLGITLVSRHETQLRMNFQVWNTVKNCRPRFFHFLRPPDVRLFIEAGLYFNECCDPLAVLRCPDQLLRHLRVLRNAV